MSEHGGCLILAVFILIIVIYSCKRFFDYRKSEYNKEYMINTDLNNVPYGIIDSLQRTYPNCKIIVIEKK